MEAVRLGRVELEWIELKRAIKIEEFLELQCLTLPKCPLPPISATFWLIFLLPGFSINKHQLYSIPVCSRRKRLENDFQWPHLGDMFIFGIVTMTKERGHL